MKAMGNSESHVSFRKAVVDLSQKTQPIDASDDSYWSQFWSETATDIHDVFTLIPSAELRTLREEMPSNLATLCYKAVERIVDGAKTLCTEPKDQQMVINCVRLLTRILPYIFEDNDWKGFFWSKISKNAERSEAVDKTASLAVSLLDGLCDLLFCPSFTVHAKPQKQPDTAEETLTVDSCEYIWEAGVGCVHSPGMNAAYERNRCDILRLLLVCCSPTMYTPSRELSTYENAWIKHLTSSENRHALALFTSLLNTVCKYDPVGYGVPYNHLMMSDYRRATVELSLQILCVCIETEDAPAKNPGTRNQESGIKNPAAPTTGGSKGKENLFSAYLSRIHREEDFGFVLRGLTTLLNNPLRQSYLPASSSRIEFVQELLILFWKVCDINKRFMFYTLKSSDVLDVVVPVLFYLSEARKDPARVGLAHIGVFILLLLSGERNFGVRLNKPFAGSAPPDVPVFSGTHADLLVAVFHKVITAGHVKLQPLYDCLLTIVVNVSPYLKTLSMVASAKLLYLLEVFSSPSFLLSQSNHHHLVFFLLEIFNNIIQYQFDGNCSLVYQIIRKRNLFHQLASLPTDQAAISKILQKARMKPDGDLGKPLFHEDSSTKLEKNVHGKKKMAGVGSAASVGVASKPVPANSMGTTLAQTPAVDQMTEKKASSVNSNRPTATSSATSSATDALRRPPPSVPPTPEDVASGSITTAVPVPVSGPSATGMGGLAAAGDETTGWSPTAEWVSAWKQKLPMQTIMRLLQVLVPQVEKICIDKGLTDETEILKFLQNGTLVGLLPVPHPILIRKYQANEGTVLWFQTYMWGVLYLRLTDPPVWFDTRVKLFEVQKL